MFQVTAFKNSEAKRVFGLVRCELVEYELQERDEERLVKKYKPKNIISRLIYKIFRKDLMGRVLCFSEMSVNELIESRFNFLGNIVCKNEKIVDKYEICGQFVVIKKIQTSLNLINHEAVVGLYGINKVIDEGILNFCYTYGIKENNIFYEYIDGKIYRNFLKICNLEQFLSTFFQIVLALKEANDLVDFTHYDLHTDNIIVKYTELEFIKYKYNNCKTSHLLPVIIDYELSHIKYNNLHYGNLTTGIIPYQIFRDRSYLIYDIYKLLIKALHIIYKYNKQIKLSQVIPILSFFTKSEDSPTDKYIIEIQLQHKDLYTIPYCKNTAQISDNEWESFISKYSLPKNYNPNITGNFSPESFISHISYLFPNILSTINH